MADAACATRAASGVELVAGLEHGVGEPRGVRNRLTAAGIGDIRDEQPGDRQDDEHHQTDKQHKWEALPRGMSRTVSRRTHSVCHGKWGESPGSRMPRLGCVAEHARSRRLSEALADDGGYTVASHRHPVEGVGDLHGAFLVSDDDQL
jgi:hypothetical protein